MRPFLRHSWPWGVPHFPHIAQREKGYKEFRSHLNAFCLSATFALYKEKNPANLDLGLLDNFISDCPIWILFVWIHPVIVFVLKTARGLIVFEETSFTRFNELYLAFSVKLPEQVSFLWLLKFASERREALRVTFLRISSSTSQTTGIAIIVRVDWIQRVKITLEISR